MDKLIYLFIILSTFPLFACQKSQVIIKEKDNNSYINDFELFQENPNNETTIKIKSPKAIIYPSTNDIEIIDSYIHIFKNNDNEIEVTSGNSTLNNFENIIKVYNNVNISILGERSSVIKTNRIIWDLNKSIIELKSPLDINFENTTIYSSDGLYDIELGRLKLNNNIFNRVIYNKDGYPSYRINIISDLAKWLKQGNSLEFTSNKKQVQTTIDFLGFK